MPEENVRFVVFGATKADKEFDQFSRTRVDGSKKVRDLQRKLDRTNRAVQKLLRMNRSRAARG